MVFKATFNNISLRSVLLEEKTGVPGENDRPAEIIVSSTPCMGGIRTHNVNGDRH